MEISRSECSACIEMLFSDRSPDPAARIRLAAAAGFSAVEFWSWSDNDLGAIKVRAGGGDPIYAIPELPKDQRAPDDHLRRVFGDWVVEVAYSANIVVLRTPPGTANVVGSALDRSGLPQVLGTVAGDDTLFVVVADGHDGAVVADFLRELAGL